MPVWPFRRRREGDLKHRDDIDGLRAVAVLPVLLFHFGTGLTPGGFTGVDVFFVISGFVIAGSVMTDLREGRFSIANFYFKRIRRIFPALVAVILATTIAATIILLPDDLLDYSRSVAATALFASNVYFWRTSGYFAAAAQTKPLLHSWSLAVEEQFYVFAPIAFALIHRYGRERWTLFFAPVLLLSFAAGIAAVFVAPTAGFFLLPTRAWELLLGALIALRGGSAPASRVAREIAAAAGLALIAYGMATLHDGDPFPGWNALFPAIGTALLLQMGVVREAGSLPLANRLLTFRPFVWIGWISYSLYLIHWPLAAFTRYRTLRDLSGAEAALLLAVSILLAWASWRFVEQPFRRARPEQRGRVLWAGAATIAALAALGGAGVLARGLPGRFPDYVQRQIAGQEEWGGDSCFNQDPARGSVWNAAACTRVHGRRGRILLWGDSFAAHYTPGILRDARRIDADVLEYSFAGCPPILAYQSYARVACAPFNARALDIVRGQHIDTVVLAARWGDTPLHTIDRLGETVAALRALGVRVFVIGQSPLFATDVQLIDYISGSRGRPGPAYWTVAFDPALNMRLARQARGATFIDPMRRLCDGQRCAYRYGSTYFFADFGHFSTAGSVRAVRDYFPAGAATPPR